MDLENRAIEKMAREYKTALAGSALVRGTGGAEAASERAVIIIEEQLDLIDALLSVTRGNKFLQRLLSYLKSIKSSSAILFSRLSGKGEYIPSFRQNDISGNLMIRLLELQINLFVLLDSISRLTDAQNLQLIENKALGVINSINISTR